VSAVAAGAGVREGYLPVPGGMVWYRRCGTGDGLPLLVVHGGPGSGSDYLEPLADLATDRTVVFYDQLGCGRSERPGRPGLWTLDRFVAELHAVRRMLRLTDLALYGHSWGGWLAIEYVLRHGAGVGALVLASTSAGLPEHRDELARLRAALPPRTAGALADPGHPEHGAALIEFYQRHLCRMEQWPAAVVEATRRENAAYRAMIGPDEVTIVGSMRSWDRTADLGSVTPPTLVTAGRFDEMTPRCAETLHRGLPRSRLEVFERSAHMPHWEQRTAYLEALRGFLAENDRAGFHHSDSRG
jgi:proline-specific peptidase